MEENANENSDKSQNFAPWLFVIGLCVFLFGILLLLVTAEEEHARCGVIAGGNIMAVSGTTVIILFVSAWMDKLKRERDKKKKDIRGRLLAVGGLIIGACALIWPITAYLFKVSLSNFANALLGLLLSIDLTVLCKGVNDAKTEIDSFLNKKKG